MDNGLTLEKMKIDERLRTVETNVGKLQTLVEERWKNHALTSLTRYEESKKDREALKISIDGLGSKINKMLTNCVEHANLITELQKRKSSLLDKILLGSLITIVTMAWVAIGNLYNLVGK